MQALWSTNKPLLATGNTHTLNCRHSMEIQACVPQRHTARHTAKHMCTT